MGSAGAGSAAVGRPNLPPAESWFEGARPVGRRPWDRFAVGGFVLSLPGLAPLAALLAVIGLRRIRRSGARGRRLAVAALALSGCWVVALGVAAALDVYGERKAGIGRSGPIADARVGQCFTADLRADTLTTVTTTDCADPHAGEVYAKVSASLAGLSPQARETAATKQCATAFQRFVGRSYEASALDMYFVVLTDDRSVADGNVLCLLGEPGQSLTGSMRGSQR